MCSTTQQMRRRTSTVIKKDTFSPSAQIRNRITLWSQFFEDWRVLHKSKFSFPAASKRQATDSCRSVRSRAWQIFRYLGKPSGGSRMRSFLMPRLKQAPSAKLSERGRRWSKEEEDSRRQQPGLKFPFAKFAASIVRVIPPLGLDSILTFGLPSRIFICSFGLSH